MPRSGPLAPRAFQGFVKAEDQRPLARVQMAQQEKAESLAPGHGRPTAPVEQVVVLGKTGFLGQAPDPQSRSHSAFARGEKGAHQEQLGFGPGLGMKEWTEGEQKVYKWSRQGEHLQPFVMVCPELTLPVPF